MDQAVLTRRWRLGIAGSATALIVFAAFALTLLRDVSAARGKLSHDVRWLLAVQALDAQVLAGKDTTSAMNEVKSFATTGEPSAQTRAALETLERQLGTPEAHAAVNELTRAIRAQTAAISTALEALWSKQSWLVFGALSVAIGTMVALVLFARTSVRLARRRQHQHEAALTEASRTADLLQALAAQVTHDLANPLAFIVSNHRYLCERFADVAERDADVADALRDSAEGLARIERLVGGLRAASALTRSSRPVRVADALEALLLLVEPRLRHSVSVVREYDAIANRLVEPLPFMRLVSTVLIDAAERCAAAPRGVVTLRATECGLVIAVQGAITRPWARTLSSVATGFTFDAAAPTEATITLAPGPRSPDARPS